MTKRVKRTRDYEINLQLNNDQFIATPRESQRNWLLNRAIKEFSDELEHLNSIAGSFVAGADSTISLADRTQGDLSNEEIMEDWQIPVMRAMADIVTQQHGDVLEIGFGRGVASDLIQQGGVNSHTVIECNDSVVSRYEAWKMNYPTRDIRICHGKWQDVIDDLPRYDGVFFHTYPLNEFEFVDQVVQSSTFAEHFFPVASQHLKPGGHFAYLTNEIDSLSRSHQRSLLNHFRSISISIVDDLCVPENTNDAMWADTMLIVQATK